MTTFLSLSQEVLLSLLSFCTASYRSPVNVTRHAVRWTRWRRHRLFTCATGGSRRKQTFRTPEKPQIIAALNEAGLSGAARDAEKMKKGDAAEHAEHHMKDNRWVRWMCAPRPQTDATERTDNPADAA